VAARAAVAESMLDLGTGGGEWLASLGISVEQVDGAPDNVEQNGELPRLPFDDDSFDLVSSRHESYVAAEVARVLRPGGVFITQQTGGDYGAFHELLGLEPGEPSGWTRAFAAAQLEAAGFTVLDGDDGVEETFFADVGALAWYLRAVPWVLGGLEIGRVELRYAGVWLPAVVPQPTFWLAASL
jgi:SAM-dependent methyltransferase